MKMRDRFVIETLALIAAVAATSLTCFSQTAASVTGYVFDQSGAAVMGAKVTLRNEGTNEQRVIATGGNGLYAFTLVLPGTYALTAAANGFSTVNVTGLSVQVAAQVRHDFTLQLGQVSSEVHVSATATEAEIDRVTPALGQVIDSQTIVALPLNGRDYLQLATLGAGVVPPLYQNGQSVGQGFGVPFTEVVSVSGVREVSDDYLYDGIPSRHAFYGSVGLRPPVDSIAEFKIQQGYFSPEYGSPAVINVVIKSGSNSLHGTLWEFFRNDVLDARNFFNPGPKDLLHQNQFGFNLGGPAIKDKLFWFGDYEGFRLSTQSPSFVTVPTPAMLQGNFSGLPTITDPETGLPFPGNMIPTTRISSFATKYNQFIPAPNSAPIAAEGNANLVGPAPDTTTDNGFEIKIDYVMSDTDTFFGRFSFLNSLTYLGSLLPAAATQTPLNSRNFAFGWTHIFSQDIVNSFRAGLEHEYTGNGASAPFSGSSNWPASLGLQNLNEIPDCNGVTNVALADYSSLGAGNSNCPINGETNKVFIDNLEIVRGSHTLTIGGELTRLFSRNIISSDDLGDLQFSGQFTGNSVADYLLGDPDLATGARPTAPEYLQGWIAGLYVNDIFHATHSLTLDYGLRWQVTPPSVEKYNQQGIFNPQTGLIDIAGQDGTPRGLLSSHWLDFAPRVGFAYSPTPNLSIRSSYGIFWDRIPGNDTAWNNEKFPFQLSTTLVSDSTVPTIDIATLFPSVSAGGVAPVGTDLFNLANRQDPYVQQWTLSLQRALPGKIILDAAYVGSHGVHLSKRHDINEAPLPTSAAEAAIPLQQRRPYPQYGFILDDTGTGGSSYNALQVNLRKELSNGLTFLAAYTYSKSLDNDSFDSRAARNYGPDDYRDDWARSIFDVRHRLSISSSYNLPGQHLRGVAGQVLGHWQLSGIFTLQTGLPFSVLNFFFDQSNTGANVISWPMPNQICNPNLSRSQATPALWFNTSCFTEPAPDTYGNAGFNNINTDGLTNLDFALMKEFPIHEGSLQFRAEAFNALNNVNFGLPGFIIGFPGYGQVTSSLPARIIQFGLKYAF
ncbi:MAG: carboxypeptidase regulatory-like domain-containing protein [Candidatus Acidiferrales bacterium]